MKTEFADRSVEGVNNLAICTKFSYVAVAAINYLIIAAMHVVL